MDADRIDAPELSPSGGVGGEEGGPTAEVEGPWREWEVVPAGEAIYGAEDPKIVEWEELQQELARLWSLSSALKKAKERKHALTQRLEPIVEVRRESLNQTNELEEMKEKLEAKKLAVMNMSLDTKIEAEDIKNQNEQLGFAIRLLLVGGKTLVSADQQLQEANKLLYGERDHGRLKVLQRTLRMRQQHMITQISNLYPIKPLNEQASRDKLDSRSTGESNGLPLPESSKASQSLTISGLQLTTLPMKKMSLFGDKKEMQRSACALGYVAHAVSLIASYLNVPLRYNLRLGGSRSYVQDYAPSIESTSSELVPNPLFTSSTEKPSEFPLFFEGQDTTRAAYAIFLLNKDLEQLLNYIGAESLGPRHVLANLKELIRQIQSSEYIDK